MGIECNRAPGKHNYRQRGKMNNRTDIIKEAIRSFGHLPTRALAEYVRFNFGEAFDGNLETIRSAIRYRRGTNGVQNRELGTDIMKREAPASIPPTWRQTRTPYKLNPGNWLVLSDVHIPFHEPKPLDAALQYGKDKKVTGILLNGDIQDCAAVSFWPSANRKDFDREIKMMVDFLDLLKQEFPDAEIVYKPGNHEYRLPRLYQSKVPEIMGLVMASSSMDVVLGLEAKGIEFLDYRQIVLAGKLPILHGDEFRQITRAVNPARGLFLRTKSYAMCGHCHTTSEHTETNIHGTVLTTWSTGCLCDLSPDYHPYGNSWCWGFALVNVEKNGSFEVQNHRILPNSVVV
jgi:predicted phosphodiesterase